MTDSTNTGEQKKIEYTVDLTQAVSINSIIEVTVNGETFRPQVTTRHGAKADQIVADFETHLSALVSIRQNHPRSGQPEQIDPGEAQYIPVETEQHTDTGTFPAGKLIAEVNNGKVGYKVTAKDGERFPKYPVRVWPEVLDGAGIKYDLINPVKPETSVPLVGWTAEYTKNEKGYPAKVVRLTK